jgi:hypothetical protein
MKIRVSGELLTVAADKHGYNMSEVDEGNGSVEER